MSDHWRYAPSSADRWMKCPGSAGASDEETQAAARGTLCHAVAESLLRRRQLAKEHRQHLQSLAQEEQDELVEAAERFVEYVRGLKADELIIESQIRHPVVPQHGGTIDALCYFDETACLHIVDLKFGLMEVSAKDNAQLKCYLNLARTLYPLAERFKATIFQPRLSDLPETVEYSRDELDEFLLDVMLATQREDFAAGNHCTWCPLLPNCETARAHSRALAQTDFSEIQELEDDIGHLAKMEEIVGFKPAFDKLVEFSKDRLLAAAQRGVKLETLKVVHKWSQWIWTDEGRLAETLAKIFPPDEIDSVMYKPTKLESLTAVQAKIKKQDPAVLKVFDLRDLATQKIVGHRLVDRSTRGEEVDFTDGFSEIDNYTPESGDD